MKIDKFYNAIFMLSFAIVIGGFVLILFCAISSCNKRNSIQDNCTEIVIPGYEDTSSNIFRGTDRSMRTLNIDSNCLKKYTKEEISKYMGYVVKFNPPKSNSNSLIIIPTL